MVQNVWKKAIIFQAFRDWIDLIVVLFFMYNRYWICNDCAFFPNENKCCVSCVVRNFFIIPTRLACILEFTTSLKKNANNFYFFYIQIRVVQSICFIHSYESASDQTKWKLYISIHILLVLIFFDWLKCTRKVKSKIRSFLLSFIQFASFNHSQLPIIIFLIVSFNYFSSNINKVAIHSHTEGNFCLSIHLGKVKNIELFRNKILDCVTKCTKSAHVMPLLFKY